MTRKKVLLLGAEGNVGSGFREEYLEKYRKSYDLVLGSHKGKVKNSRGLKVVKVDLSKIESLKKAMKGVDAVINLAANPKPSAEFEDLVEPNIIGAYNVLRLLV